MAYEFAIRRPGRPDVEVPHPAESLLIETSPANDLLRVTVSWCKSKVERKRHSADNVLRSLWPGVDELVMFQTSETDPDAERVEVFSGVIESVEYADGLLTVKAVQEVLDPMEVTVEPDPDVASGRGFLVVVDNDNRVVAVDWGDGSDQTLNAGNGFQASPHEYAQGGAYEITLTDIALPERTHIVTVEVPEGAP